MPRLLPRVCAPWSRPQLFPLQAACKRQPDSRAESEPLPLAVRQHPLSARGLECQREGGEDGLWPRRPLRGRLGGPAASAASSHRPRLLARAFSFPRRSAGTGHGHCKAVQLCEDAVVPGGQRLFPPQGPLPSSSVPTTLPGRGPLSPERRPRPRRGTSLSRSVLRERRGPPAGTRGGRRLRPAPAQTEPAAATGRCARAAKAPRSALRRSTMSSLYTRSKEFPRSRRAQPESPPASPSPTAKALRVSGAPLGTCRPWRGSGPGRRLLAGVGEGAQPRPAQRQSAWQRGSGVLVTLPPGAGVGLCSCSRGARGCRPTRSPMRAPRVCVHVSVRATAFARLGVRGRQGQLATRAVSLLIPRKRARGAREAAPAAGTSREGRRGRRARGLRVRECFRQSRCRSSRGHVGVRSSRGRATRSPLLPAEPCAASMREAEGRCAARRRLPRRESPWSRIRSVACRSGRRSSRTPRGALRAVSLTVPSEGGPRAPARGSGRPSLPRGLVPCLLGPHSVEPFSLVFPAFPPPSRRSPLLHLSTP